MQHADSTVFSIVDVLCHEIEPLLSRTYGILFVALPALGIILLPFLWVL